MCSFACRDQPETTSLLLLAATRGMPCCGVSGHKLTGAVARDAVAKETSKRRARLGLGSWEDWEDTSGGNWKTWPETWLTWGCSLGSWRCETPLQGRILGGSWGPLESTLKRRPVLTLSRKNPSHSSNMSCVRVMFRGKTHDKKTIVVRRIRWMLTSAHQSDTYTRS